LAHGRFGVDEVLGPFTDPDVRAVFDLVEVDVDPALTAEFPDRRLTAVEIEFANGERLEAGPLEAAGEPDDPELPAVAAAKVQALIGPDQFPMPASADRLAGLGPRQLLGILCNAPMEPGDA